MRRSFRNLLTDSTGAVAPIVALSLVGLIAIGGVAFDYARVASMDTELQNAADQAALAAASQLDGNVDACSRANAAARQLVANLTYMANDGNSDGQSVVVPNEPTCDATGSVRFYQNAAKTTAATNDSNAKFVEIAVAPREAIYALTPIVAAFRSGNINALAFAGLGEAYCKTPPVMICNPQETASSTDFNASTLAGKGLRLVSVGGSGGTWAPGNFGYLDTGITSPNGAVDQLRAALGWETPPGNCVQATSVNTKPGANTTVTDALNTRFDIYQNDNTSCYGTGFCPAAADSVKDVRRAANATGNNACKFNSGGWNLPAGYYGSGSIPSSATTALDSSITPSAMGHPRDMCHAVASGTAGACAGPIGDGNWDRDAYFRTNYRRSDGTYWTGGTGAGSWQGNTGLSSTAKRYDVYVWEMLHRTEVIDGVTILGPTPAGATGSTNVAYGSPVCGTPSIPGPLTPDRRKLTIAVVNCLEESVNGNSTGVVVKDWLDVFLVEPSINRERTSDGDVYVEVVGRSGNLSNSSAQQIKKAVPYLIE